MGDRSPSRTRRRVRQSEEITLEQHHVYPSENSPQAPYFQILDTSRQDLEQPFDFDEYCHDHYGNKANELYRDPIPMSGIYSGRGLPHYPRHSELITNTLARNERLPLRGVECAEASGPAFRNHEEFKFGLSTQHAMQGIAAGASISSTPMSAPHSTSGGPPPPRNSQYADFKGQFKTPESAKEYRKSFTYFNRKPYRDPYKDASIEEIVRDRLLHVERIYNAMTCGDHARDNKLSVAMKRWVHNAHYASDLVESYAHKVLDSLIEQVNHGFRGWIHNDYVADDRKQEGEDKDVNCAQRLNNIIAALEQEKTVCEDVMNSGCQIRMFVNAPKAYANRKLQNRVGNSKRGRTKDAESDTAERPSKARKPNSRVTARAPTSSSSLASAGARYLSQTPETRPLNHTQPRFATPSARSTHSPPTTSYSHLSLGPVNRTGNVYHSPVTPSGIHQANYMSPAPTFSSPLQCVASMPPQHQAFLSLPQPFAIGFRSAPVTPGDAKPVNAELQPSPPVRSIEQQLYPAYLSPESIQDPYWGLPADEMTLFESLSDAAPPIDPALNAGSPKATSSLREIWDAQHGMQISPQQ